jgi:hypothetical protein
MLDGAETQEGEDAKKLTRKNYVVQGVLLRFSGPVGFPVEHQVEYKHHVS